MIRNKIGIMQGRLLPKLNGRYQAHPIGYWADEFPIAAALNIDCIEFIFDFNDYSKNPLYTREGIGEIQTVVDNTGVTVVSICADYFMEAPLHHPDADVVEHSQHVMMNLFKNADLLGVKDIVLPCVDQSGLKDSYEIELFIKNIQPVVEMAEKLNVNLCLETDLGPKDFSLLLDQLPSKNVTVNYDTGNSASLGYNPIEEFENYGIRISDIHIKDRKRNGGSVFLGTGDTRFNLFFEAFKTIDFNGPFIMQAFRDEQGIDIFEQQLSFFKNKLIEL
jgi:sugar phosphate isomerase/epimerase